MNQSQGSSLLSPNRREFMGVAAAALVGSGKGLASISRQGQRPDALPIVDMHAHWTPEPFVAALREVGSGREVLPLNIDLERRLRWMDDHGVRVHCLTILTPPWQWAPAALAARLCRIVNDAASEAHAAFPSRFVAGVAMPVQDARLALEELNRVAGSPAFRGVHLPNSLNGADYLFEPSFEPVLARIAALELPILFHPLTAVPDASRLTGPAFLNNTIGFPMEHTIVAARFITSGVLDRFPSLNVLLAHAGGAFPYVAGRIAHGLQRRKITLKHPFESYVRRFHYDTIAYYPETLHFLIDFAGADRVVIGTDNFAAMDLESPSALLDRVSLAPDDRNRILHGNASRLLRL